MPPVLSALIFILLILLMLLIGTAAMTFMAGSANGEPSDISPGRGMIAGFLCVSALTELLIVPAVLKNVLVSTFTSVWWVVFGTIAVLCAVYCRNSLRGSLSAQATSLKHYFRDCKCGGVYGILANILVLGQLAGSLLLTHYDDDDSAYVTMIFSNVTEDRFMRVNGQTGFEVPLADMVEYITTGWYSFLSVIIKSTGIHPLVLTHTILPPLMIAMAYAVCYMFAKRVFREDEKRSLFMIFCSLINILGNVSTHTSSSVLLMRMHQGKAIFANIIIPVMFCLFFMLWDSCDKVVLCLVFLVINTAACFFSTSGLVYGAMLTVIYCIILCVKDRTIAPFLSACISLLPNVAFGMVYVLERTRGIWQ